jgi:hypothetical protein
MKVTTLILQTVGFALLLSVATTSAVGISVTATTGAGKTLRAVDGTHSAEALVSRPSILKFEPFQPGGNDGDDRNHDGDHDRKGEHDRDHDRDRDRAPAPAPEPLTALLFGAAMLIGGGILRRQHRRSHS